MLDGGKRALNDDTKPLVDVLGRLGHHQETGLVVDRLYPLYNLLVVLLNTKAQTITFPI